MSKIRSNSDFDSTNIGFLIYKWKKHLLIIVFAVIILSLIFSSRFFITPLYRSTVILFPTSSLSISKSLLSENVTPGKDVLEFGEDEQTERMLQVLNSNRIRDRIIIKYNLMDHYRIDTSSKYKNTKLYDEYENNITFRRTEYMAVKITVYDRDPQVAADIANDIANLLDSTINVIQKERAEKAFRIVEEEYNQSKAEIRQMQDSIKQLMVHGIHDYESQAEMINQQLAIELAKGNTQAVNRLEGKLQDISMYGSTYLALIGALEYEAEQLSLIKARYKEAKVDAEQTLPQKFIVNEAYKAERKSYPIRWLIVVVSVFSVLIMSMIVILGIENFRKIRVNLKGTK